MNARPSTSGGGWSGWTRWSKCAESKHSTHLGTVQNVNYFLAKINIYNICSISGSNIVCLPLSPSSPNYVAARTSAHSVARIPALVGGKRKRTRAEKKLHQHILFIQLSLFPPFICSTRRIPATSSRPVAPALQTDKICPISSFVTGHDVQNGLLS